MKKMKQFGKYILLIVGCYIISNILIYFCITTSYSQMNQEVRNSGNIQINVDYAKSTLINGKVEGTVKNNSDSDLANKYIKCDFISKRGTLILTKYAKIEELKAGEEKKFSIVFTAENIKEVRMQITDEYQEGENTKLVSLYMMEDASNEDKAAAFISFFILVHCLI